MLLGLIPRTSRPGPWLLKQKQALRASFGFLLLAAAWVLTATRFDHFPVGLRESKASLSAMKQVHVGTKTLVK
jgi:thiol:disulfide interchange protein